MNGTKKMKLSPDAYASSVVNELQNGFAFGRSRAVDAVQRNESYIRKGLAAGVAPTFVARRIASKSKAEWGKSVAGLAGGRRGLSAGKCVGYIPPLFVTPEIGDALEKNSRGDDLRGAIFGKKSDVEKAGIKQGVYTNQAGSSWTKGGAKYVSASRNSKIGAVDTTWASIESSCVDCDFKTAKVCYAMGGNAQYTVYAMDKAAAAGSETATDTAVNEADCIDSAYNGGRVPEGRILRVHSAGDTSTIEGARAIGKAIDRWYKRGGAIAYTYTHAWRRVPRAAFGRLSVLASLNPGDNPRLAFDNGYGSVTALFTNEDWAARMVLTKTGAMTFKKIKLISNGRDIGGGLDFIPCPAQYPIDGKSNREAFRWKLTYLGARIGIRGERALTDFVDKMKTVKFDSRGLPLVADHPGFQKYALQIKSAGLPDVNSSEFRTMFRQTGEEEKATCDRCRLCYDDKSLGRSGRAIAFRGDKSGGIVKTESLLRKQVKERIDEAAE